MRPIPRIWKNLLGLKITEANSLTILAGRDKFGKEENFKELTINKSEIISIGLPTGSGKSRLLGDIEWVADRDTRQIEKILINGQEEEKNGDLVPIINKPATKI